MPVTYKRNPAGHLTGGPLMKARCLLCGYNHNTFMKEKKMFVFGNITCKNCANSSACGIICRSQWSVRRKYAKYFFENPK